MYRLPWVDITTILPCPNRCSYCPQDKLMEHYKWEKVLTLKTFKRILENIPKTVELHFGGFSESFVNSETVDMMLYANEKGYRVGVWTTLVGLSEEDAERIKDIPFVWFHVHDIGQPKRDYEFITEWKKVENPNSRGGSVFEITRRENIKCGRSTNYYANVMLPNGDVVICCSDWRIEYVIGNLLTTNYDDLVRPEGVIELCHYCEYAINK